METMAVRSGRNPSAGRFFPIGEVGFQLEFVFPGLGGFALFFKDLDVFPDCKGLEVLVLVEGNHLQIVGTGGTKLIRRMAEEMVGLAHQLAMDFDYSNVSIYDGDLVDEDLDPQHPAFLGLWVLNEEGPAFVAAEDFDEEDADADGAPN